MLIQQKKVEISIDVELLVQHLYNTNGAKREQKGRIDRKQNMIINIVKALKVFAFKAFYVVHLEGLDPPTCALVVRYSIQLSYR